MSEKQLTPEEAEEIGRKVAESWLAQREIIVAFLEGLGQGLSDPPEEEER